jgi:hypothetical protein
VTRKFTLFLSVRPSDFVVKFLLAFYFCLNLQSKTFLSRNLKYERIVKLLILLNIHSLPFSLRIFTLTINLYC